MKPFLKGLGIAAIIVLSFLLLGFGTMLLWNWLMPYLFKLPIINFYQAVGLFALSKILFGSIKANGGQVGHRKYWKAKWESMSEDERQQFKSEFAERCRHKWGMKQKAENKD